MTIKLRCNQSICTKGQIAFLKSTAPMVLLSGGFGAGKTLGLGLKLLQLKSENPHAPGLLMAQSWRSLWSITLRRLMGFLRTTLPPEAMPKVVGRNDECYLDFGDGVPIFLRSAHDPGSFDGLDVGWGLGDEPRHWKKHSHEVFMGRIRVACKRPQLCYSSTPAMNWLHEEFNTGRKDRELIRSPTSENAKNLAPNFIENLRLSYSKRMQAAVIEGFFTPLEGVVYDEVDLHSENSPWFTDAPIDLKKKISLAVDPGFRRSAWLWLQEDTPTSWTVIDQMMPEQTSDQVCVQRVNDRNIPIDEIWCDPAADQTESTIGLDTLAMLPTIKGRNGNTPAINYIAGPYRSVSYGVDKVRALLGTSDGSQPIRIKFHENLRRQEIGTTRGILRDLCGYQYGEAKDGRPITDEPLKDGHTDHACDALRYFGVGKWLSSPLRALDFRLANAQKLGYKKAA